MYIQKSTRTHARIQHTQMCQVKHCTIWCLCTDATPYHNPENININIKLHKYIERNGFSQCAIARACPFPLFLVAVFNLFIGTPTCFYSFLMHASDYEYGFESIFWNQFQCKFKSIFPFLFFQCFFEFVRKKHKKFPLFDVIVIAASFYYLRLPAKFTTNYASDGAPSTVGSPRCISIFSFNAIENLLCC